MHDESSRGSSSAPEAEAAEEAVEERLLHPLGGCLGIAGDSRGFRERTEAQAPPREEPIRKTHQSLPSKAIHSLEKADRLGEAYTLIADQARAAIYNALADVDDVSYEVEKLEA